MFENNGANDQDSTRSKIRVQIIKKKDFDDDDDYKMVRLENNTHTQWSITKRKRGKNATRRLVNL